MMKKFYEALPAPAEFHIRKDGRKASRILLPFGRRKLRSEFLYLLCQKLSVGTACKRSHLKPVRVFSDHIQRLGSYGAGTPQNSNFFHNKINLLSHILNLCQELYAVKYHRRRKQHAVKSVKNAAVTRNEITVVFNSHLPLKCGG